MNESSDAITSVGPDGKACSQRSHCPARLQENAIWAASRDISLSHASIPAGVMGRPSETRPLSAFFNRKIQARMLSSLLVNTNFLPSAESAKFEASSVPAVM